ncbi:integumentary mucin C.1-like isoform X2 [Stegastes partitus]|uniref:Integumentary mucin C.1-like isoform X2 n=1 Tax=Stegastes partitus TaxID=144197 RepID=A0A9Y4NS02_9TELE|nr:PREDICTED: integumentary mucin C.1-like isoform X2 [Stegastes partitus]
MDNRLVFTVLLVMLSSEFIGTYAQSSVTATTISVTTTTAATTTASATTTTATTTAPATTTTVTTATAAPTTTGTTVSVCPATQISINRSECGSQRLCAAEPSDCDASTDASCSFLSAQQTSGQMFRFELTGESTGYVAATLSTDTTGGGNDTSYVCANNNGTVDIFGALLDNNMLTRTTLEVTCLSAIINGTTIQCTFNATIPDSTARTTSFSLAISNGTFNSTSGSLGTPNTILRSPVLNLAQPNVTVVNLVNNSTTNATTVAPTTTAHAVTLQQSLLQALLLTVAALAPSML